MWAKARARMAQSRNPFSTCRTKVGSGVSKPSSEACRSVHYALSLMDIDSCQDGIHQIALPYEQVKQRLSAIVIRLPSVWVRRLSAGKTEAVTYPLGSREHEALRDRVLVLVQEQARTDRGLPQRGPWMACGRTGL
jgi:hypothetical protein